MNETPVPRDRTVMHVLYGMHTVSPFTLLSLSVVALVINYIQRGNESDPLYVGHHSYMIATFWWTLLWLVLLSPLWLVFFLPWALAYALVWLWYLYRCLKGWLRFNDQRWPQTQTPTPMQESA